MNTQIYDSFPNVKFDIEDLNNNSDSFITKFKAITILKENEKLTIHNKNLYIDERYYLQGLLRWLSGQGRDKINDFLIREFDDYCKFIDMLSMVNTHEISFKDTEVNKIKTLLELHKENIRIYMKGLGILKVTYKDTLKLEETLTKIIDNLNNKLK